MFHVKQTIAPSLSLVFVKRNVVGIDRFHCIFYEIVEGKFVFFFNYLFKLGAGFGMLGGEDGATILKWEY
jgi:hypothetical protein